MDATMVYEGSPEFLELSGESLAAFQKMYGRKLLPGEVGCSLSHNRERFLASKNPFGALIIEEDAKIQDLELLVTTTLEFLNTRFGKNGILSFYNNEFRFTRNNQPFIRGRWIRSIGAPSSTVAYAITNKSARVLFTKNSPVSFLADWPITDTSFYIAAMDVVSHSDDPHLSQIGPRSSRQNGFTFWDRMKILTFIYYIDHKNQFSSFSEFLSFLWLPRFKYQLNRFVFSLLYCIGVLN
jgi:GR25 family glycosyltransferase involved in LPS biosynthesis